MSKGPQGLQGKSGEGERGRNVRGEEKQCIKAQNGKVNWATVHEWDAGTGIYKWGEKKSELYSKMYQINILVNFYHDLVLQGH